MEIGWVVASFYISVEMGSVGFDWGLMRREQNRMNQWVIYGDNGSSQGIQIIVKIPRTFSPIAVKRLSG